MRQSSSAVETSWGVEGVSIIFGERKQLVDLWECLTNNYDQKQAHGNWAGLGNEGCKHTMVNFSIVPNPWNFQSRHFDQIPKERLR